MIRWFKQLDDVLRGNATREGRLGEGPDRVSVRGLIAVSVLLSGVYGLGAGSFAAIRTGGDDLQQMWASAAKMPLLFFLTLLVTIFSLYVFSALVGAQMKPASVCWRRWWG